MSKEAAVKVVALSAIQHDGKNYAEGQELEVGESQAVALIAAGAAKPAAQKAASDKK